VNGFATDSSDDDDEDDDDDDDDDDHDDGDGDDAGLLVGASRASNTAERNNDRAVHQRRRGHLGLSAQQ
jgi:hypothetical protein